MNVITSSYSIKRNSYSFIGTNRLLSESLSADMEIQTIEPLPSQIATIWPLFKLLHGNYEN